MDSSEKPSDSGQWDVWKKLTECEDIPEEPQEWNAEAIYTAGDRVLHDGQLFEAKWWTQGENPNDSGQWDVWKKIIDPEDIPEGPVEWNTESIYTAGDQVLHDGQLFEAKWWTQGENPNDSGQWDVWKKISE
ncbi:carbohydrate-binding protein [Bacillus sp. JCM 19041]|uniref:carbohydrate-binding protein n=1 Tax=Bacillus sp. JCM 19041 TaxID=1460637 RepID=UPI0006CFCD8A